MIQAYALGQSWSLIATTFTERPQTVRKYANSYIRDGFDGLCQPIKRTQPMRLTAE